MNYQFGLGGRCSVRVVLDGRHSTEHWKDDSGQLLLGLFRRDRGDDDGPKISERRVGKLQLGCADRDEEGRDGGFGGEAEAEDPQ